MEDQSELIFSKEFLIHSLKNKRNYVPEKDIRYDLDKIIFKALHRRYEYYILSFSSVKNDFEFNENDGNLSMWRYFGKNDYPVYLEFDLEILLKTNKAKTCIIDDVYYWIKRKSENEGKFKKYANIFWENYSKIGKSKTALHDLVEPFMKIVSLVKHPAFHDEREFRIFLANELDENVRSYQNKKKGRPDDLGPITYIPYTFNPESLLNIVIGPFENQQEKKKELLEKLISYPEFSHTKVFLSKIPTNMVSKIKTNN